jgi:hypothetical protein
MHVTFVGARARQVGRALVFAGFTLWILAGPVYVQILHGAQRLYAWRMFGSRGLGVVEVRFERGLPDGTRAPLERTTVLGYPSRFAAPRDLRRIMGEDGLRRAVSELCAKLGAGADLRVHARLGVADGDGWRVLDDGATNACTKGRDAKAGVP